MFPQPWASDPTTSHVVSAKDWRQIFDAAGLTILEWSNETNAHIELARAARQSGLTPPPEQMMANEVALGQSFMGRRANYIAALASGALASIAILATPAA